MQHTTASDVWSLGLVLYAVVRGLPPARGGGGGTGSDADRDGAWLPRWRGDDGSEGALPHRVLFPTPVLRLPGDTPVDVRSLLAAMLSMSPRDRPTAAQVVARLEIAGAGAAGAGAGL